MMCAVCTREGRGFVWHAPRTGPLDQNGKRVFKRFCSMVCLNIYTHKAKEEGGSVINPTTNEKKAMQACLGPLWQCLEHHGIDKPVSQYSKAEVLQLIDVVVTAYQDHLREMTDDDMPF